VLTAYGLFTGRTGTGPLAVTNTGIRDKELAAEFTLFGQWPPPEQGFRKKVIEGSKEKMKGRKMRKKLEENDGKDELRLSPAQGRNRGRFRGRQQKRIAEISAVMRNRTIA